jgi:polar amino acid transport system substrate-binding protein
MPIRSMRLASWLAVLVGAALIVAGCGSSSSSSSTKSSTPSTSTPAATAADPTVAAEVPAKIKSNGTLTVAADATYAPNEFIQGGSTVVGMDADLAKALAGVMGLKANVSNVTFDSIIPKLVSGNYDLGMSSFTDTKEREKTVDFVTYFSAGTSFYVKASGGAAVASLSDLCGKSVAVEKGTTQQTDAAGQSKTCKTGKVNVLVFPDQNSANLALSSGRAQVGMADSPVAAYAVKQSGGQFKLSGQPYGTAPYGIAMGKSSGLSKPILDALKVLMANGKYTAILSTWGVQSGAITSPVVNGATS